MKTFSIIGCQHGHIGIFIQEMLELGHRCAGIYEAENLALAKALSEQFRVPLVSDLEELLNDGVEIVGCAAINNEKIDIIELCEKHGKHIMVDKPAVTNRNGLDRLKGVIERGRIQIGMLLTERFRSSVYTMKKLIDEGSLGEIVHISMRKPHRLNPEARPQWHFSKKQNGGIVIDLLIHDFDLLRWLTGKEISSVEGYMAKHILPEHPGFYDTAGLQVLMEGQILGQLYADWYNPRKSWTWGDCRIFVTGTEGMIELRLEGDPLAGRNELLLKVTNNEELESLALEEAPVCISQDFLRRLAGGGALINHNDILLATEATIEADERVKKLVGLK
jgi:predicted dehydrogenase